MKSVSLAFAASTVLAAAASAQTYYVDPVNGIDVAGAGSASVPFQSMTFAVASATGGPLTLLLQPGVYSSSSGESFPLDLPPDVTVEGLLARGARIRHELASPGGTTATAALRVDWTSGGGSATLRNLTLNGNQNGLRVRALGGGSHQLTVENVRTQMTVSSSSGSGLGMKVVADDASGSSNVFFTLSRVHSTDQGTGVWFQTGGFGSLYGTIEKSSYTNERGAQLPTGTAVRSQSNGSGEIELILENTSIYRRQRGVAVHQHDSTNQYLYATHCAFQNCGLTSFVGGIGQVVSGGVVEHVAGTPTTFDVYANAFYGNAAELPDYSAGVYSVADCVIQTPALAALAGNQSGDPMWLSAATGDFHILPGSPCRNAIFAYLDEDADGDERDFTGAGCAGDGDIGLDESFDYDLHFTGGNIAGLGATVETNLFGDGGSVAYVVTGTPTNAPCGLSQIDANNYVQLATATLPGTPGTRDWTTATFSVPTSPSLVGSAFDISAAFVINPSGIPSLEYAANLRVLEVVN